MPRGRFFSYDVFIGKEQVQEVRGKDGNVYIETDLNVPGVSFTKEEVVIAKHGEEEKQSWPVTPYRVELSVERDHYTDSWYWFDMFVDGSRVWNKPLRNGRNMCVDISGRTFLARQAIVHSDRCLGLCKGPWTVKRGHSVNYCFRYLATNKVKYVVQYHCGDDFNSDVIHLSDHIEEGRQSEIGRIVVTCKEAIFSGYREKTFRARDTSRRGQGASDRSDFRQATKSDCSGRGLMTTAPGRELYRFTDQVERVGRETLFTRGRLVEELSVHYRMRQELVDMGLMEEPHKRLEVSDKTGEKNTKTSEENNSREAKAELLSDANNNPKQKLRSHLKQVEALSGNMKQMNVDSDGDSKSTADSTDCKSAALKSEKVVTREPFNPALLQPIRTRVVEEVILTKNEKGQDVKMTRRTESMPLERYIRVDDDIFIVESLDDSVVYIGDDECYVVEPPVREFPYVELE